MCGIAGIFERDKDNKELMSEMLASIEHRGPDDHFIYTYRDFTLGHRRLSIIDVSTCGNQPIFNEDKSICVVFNGEIYNYEEIREELKAWGFTVTSCLQFKKDLKDTAEKIHNFIWILVGLAIWEQEFIHKRVEEDVEAYYYN